MCTATRGCTNLKLVPMLFAPYLETNINTTFQNSKNLFLSPHPNNCIEYAGNQQIRAANSNLQNSGIFAELYFELKKKTGKKQSSSSSLIKLF